MNHLPSDLLPAFLNRYRHLNIEAAILKTILKGTGVEIDTIFKQHPALAKLIDDNIDRFSILCEKYDNGPSSDSSLTLPEIMALFCDNQNFLDITLNIILLYGKEGFDFIASTDKNMAPKDKLNQLLFYACTKEGIKLIQFDDIPIHDKLFFQKNLDKIVTIYRNSSRKDSSFDYLKLFLHPTLKKENRRDEFLQLLNTLGLDDFLSSIQSSDYLYEASASTWSEYFTFIKQNSNTDSVIYSQEKNTIFEHWNDFFIACKHLKDTKPDCTLKNIIAHGVSYRDFCKIGQNDQRNNYFLIMHYFEFTHLLILHFNLEEKEQRYTLDQLADIAIKNEKNPQFNTVIAELMINYYVHYDILHKLNERQLNSLYSITSLQRKLVIQFHQQISKYQLQHIIDISPLKNQSLSQIIKNYLIVNTEHRVVGIQKTLWTYEKQSGTRYTFLFIVFWPLLEKHPDIFSLLIQKGFFKQIKKTSSFNSPTALVKTILHDIEISEQYQEAKDLFDYFGKRKIIDILGHCIDLKQFFKHSVSNETREKIYNHAYIISFIWCILNDQSKKEDYTRALITYATQHEIIEKELKEQSKEKSKKKNFKKSKLETILRSPFELGCLIASNNNIYSALEIAYSKHRARNFPKEKINSCNKIFFPEKNNDRIGEIWLSKNIGPFLNLMFKQKYFTIYIKHLEEIWESYAQVVQKNFKETYLEELFYFEIMRMLNLMLSGTVSKIFPRDFHYYASYHDINFDRTQQSTSNTMTHTDVITLPSREQRKYIDNYKRYSKPKKRAINYISSCLETVIIIQLYISYFELRFKKNDEQEDSPSDFLSPEIVAEILAWKISSEKNIKNLICHQYKNRETIRFFDLNNNLFESETLSISLRKFYPDIKNRRQEWGQNDGISINRETVHSNSNDKSL